MEGGIGRYLLACAAYAFFYTVIAIACIFFGRAAWDFYGEKIKPWLFPEAGKKRNKEANPNVRAA